MALGFQFHHSVGHRLNSKHLVKKPVLTRSVKTAEFGAVGPTYKPPSFILVGVKSNCLINETSFPWKDEEDDEKAEKLPSRGISASRTASDLRIRPTSVRTSTRELYQTCYARESLGFDMSRGQGITELHLPSYGHWVADPVPHPDNIVPSYHAEHSRSMAGHGHI